MTKSAASVYVVVRLDFLGHDVGQESINEAIQEMDYDFKYESYHASLVDSEIVDVLYKYDSEQ